MDRGSSRETLVIPAGANNAQDCSVAVSSWADNVRLDKGADIEADSPVESVSGRYVGRTNDRSDQVQVGGHRPGQE